MKKIINKFKLYLYFILTIIISNLSLSTFNNLGLSDNITKIISIIIFIIFFFIAGFIKGKNIDKKGYIQGLKVGIKLSLILFLLSLFNYSFDIKTIIYYSILILAATLGSTFGINKK
ncbi:MAG: TIGR04086 family membrane protein [Firmicutes bacterium]|nr:TIGR04086 family membrane protein [Bacillota bacterium]